MKCHVCGSEFEPTMTDLPFKLDRQAIVIIKGLPVLQCSRCREFLIEDAVMQRVEELLNSAAKGAELEVVRYAA